MRQKQDLLRDTFDNRWENQGIAFNNLAVSAEALLDFLETYPHPLSVDISGFIADLRNELDEAGVR